MVFEKMNCLLVTLQVSAKYGENHRFCNIKVSNMND